jgi:exosortase family protein XrtF
VLFGLYSLYLKATQIKEPAFVCSPITKTVANHTQKVLNVLGYHVVTENHPKELSVKLLVSGNYTARVIEGCNSVSLIILFIAFIVAFPGRLKVTILYALTGSAIIYVVNVLRIGFLTMILYKYPDEKGFFHNLLFPLIIYGLVFLLWVVWVNLFSKYKKIKNAKIS